MASLPVVPIESNYLRPTPDVTGQMAQLADLTSSTRARNALLPGQVQQQQGQIESQQIQNQIQRLQLQDAQGINGALRDIYGSDKGSSGPAAASSPPLATNAPGITAPSWYKGTISGIGSVSSQAGNLASMVGVPPAPAPAAPAPAAQSSQATPAATPDTPEGRVNALIQRIQDPKFGISLQGQTKAIEMLNTMRTGIAGADEKTLANIENAHKVISQGLNSVLEAPPEEQQAAWQKEYATLMQNPTLAKFANTISPQYPGTPAAGGSPEAQRMLHGLMLEKDVIDATKAKAELPGQQAESKAKELTVAPPTQEQMDTFTKTTLPSFTNMTPAQRASFSQQAQQARTVPEFNKVLETADATDKAMQMHRDTMAQTMAIVGNKFQQAGLTDNEKIWTDPQRGYAGALAQANQTKASIKAGVDGNALLTNMVPTMEVLGINHAAGINRISPQEAASARVSPDWATRWNAWATAAMTGKLTPELAKQGQQLMDIVTDAAYQRSVQSGQFIAKGHNLDPSQVPAMNRDGSITTLDKVTGTKNSAAAEVPAAVQAALSKAGPGIHTLSDKSVWKKDADGTITKQ